LLGTLPALHAPINVDFVKAKVPDRIIEGIPDITKLHRIVNAVNAQLKGNFNGDFREWTSFAHVLRTLNPGLRLNYDIVRDQDGRARFGRLAIMFKSQAKMTKGSKPIISLDGGHFKHPLWSGYQALICCGQDGSNRDQVFGLAIVSSESEESYKFFLDTLMEDEEMDDFLQQPGLIVTSDRSKGLINAVQTCLPLAHHRYCALHLLGNIKSGRAFNQADKSLYWSIVAANTKEDFDTRMAVLKDTHKEAYEYLSQIDPKHWSNWKVPSKAWGHFTNNLSERGIKFLGTDLDIGRKLPICKFLDHYISKIR
jgi:hypothetical protein